jgi:RNA polymerase sigma factor (sigma-70 family)
MNAPPTNLLRQVRHLMAAHTVGQQTDRQLLEDFRRQREEGAFALLVRRHGPMVLGVCRRVLGHEKDAEDVFQAVFLVLAKKAGSIRQTDVGGYLYRVAYHLALRARAGAARRAASGPARLPAPTSLDPADDVTWREVRAVLDEELQRLPDALRSAVVLCYLEGKTHEQAARQLGWSKSTLRRRLDRGRERLRHRLLARGLAPAAALTASLFVHESAPAQVPALLTQATVRMAVTRQAAPAIAALAEANLAVLSVRKTKMLAALLLLASLLTGAGLWTYHSAASPVVSPSATKAGEKPPTAPPKPEAAKMVEIQGRVLDPEGKPKAGAKLLLLGEHEKIVDLGTTAEDGRFTVSVPKEASTRWLIAQAEGAGCGFSHLDTRQPGTPVELRLVKDQVIRGQVVSTEGKPVAGVRVVANDVNSYYGSLDQLLAYWKKRQVGGPMFYGDPQLGEAAGALFATTTDAEGRFVLRGLGVERLVSLHLTAAGLADVEVWIANRPGFDPRPYNQAVLDNSFKDLIALLGKGRQLHGPEVSVVAEVEKPIRGIVKDADTGAGRPNVWVQLTQMDERPQNFHLRARTDAEGRYEIHGARKAKSYPLAVSSDLATGHMGCQLHADDTPGFQALVADLEVKKGVIITGRMLDQATGKPVGGFVRAAVLIDNSFVKRHPQFESAGWDPVGRTDANGVFRVVAPPGPVLLMGGPSVTGAGDRYKNSVPDPQYKQYFHTRPNYVAYYGLGGGWSPIQGNFFKVLDLKPDAKIVEQDIILERAPALTVHIQDADGKPLDGVYIVGKTAEGHWPSHPEGDVCSAYSIEPGKPRLMIFYHPKRRLIGTITLKGDEKEPVVKLGPFGALRGRLLDADGKPMAGVIVDLRYRQRDVATMHRCIHDSTTIVTDAGGAFTHECVIPGFEMELSFRRGKRRFERTAKPMEATIQVKSGETRELGAIQLKEAGEKGGE